MIWTKGSTGRSIDSCVDATAGEVFRYFAKTAFQFKAYMAVYTNPRVFPFQPSGLEVRGSPDGRGRLQVNVVNRDTLLNAQQMPETKRDLIVLIAGCSAYLCSLENPCKTRSSAEPSIRKQGDEKILTKIDLLGHFVDRD